MPGIYRGIPKRIIFYFRQGRIDTRLITRTDAYDCL